MSLKSWLRKRLLDQHGPTIQVSVPMAEQIRDWSEPVRVRYVDDPVPMLEFRSVPAEVWYWVTPVDNPDALGDYGGFTFQTYDEAKGFIDDEYKEWRRLQSTGYYEPHSSPDLLQIETVHTVKVDVVEEEPRG